MRARVVRGGKLSRWCGDVVEGGGEEGLGRFSQLREDAEKKGGRFLAGPCLFWRGEWAGWEAGGSFLAQTD